MRTLAIALLIFPQFLYAQWQKQVLPLESFEDLYGISFLSDTDFYICSNTEVSHTTDSGANWQVKNLNEGFPFTPFVSNTLYDLHFFNSTSGLATGALNLTNNELIIRTDDGNQSWSIAYLNTSLMPPVYFTDLDVLGQNVLACGEDGHIIRSTDGGNSFSSVAIVSGLSLTDILFLDANRAIALGQDKVLRSNDGGASWAIDPLFTGKGACCMARANANTLYMVSEGNLLRSTDDGAGFTAASPNPVPGGVGLLAASNDTIFTANTLGICVSVDGGANWRQFKSTRNFAVNRLVIRNGKAYALCDGAALFTLNMAGMSPEPIAFFEPSVHQECGKTTLVATTPNDTSKVTLSWFLNDIPVGNSPQFNKVYTSYVTDNQNLKLVVTDKSTQQADTLIITPGIPFWEQASADAGMDQHMCYGSRAVLQPLGYYYQYQWVTDNAIDWPFNWDFNSIDGDATYPLTQDIQIVLKTWTEPQCSAYDTVQIVVDEAYHENFHFTDPKIPNACNNASCAYIPDLQFVNEQVGYGMTSNGYFIKTSDAGKTWTKTALAGGASFSPRGSIDFIDELTGFTTCPNRMTTDGGQTFTPIPAPHNGSGYTDFVDFVDATTGVYVASSSFSPGYSTVFKTTDGGQTFNGILGCNFQLKDIEYFNTNTIFVAGGYSYYGTVLKSTDGGQSWDTIPIPQPELVVWSIDVISEDTFFISDVNYIHRTYDSGQNWYSYFSPFGAGKIEMVNSQIGYATGYYNNVFKTVNGGDCWTKVFEGEYPSVDAIAIPPGGNSIYFTANDYQSPENGPVVYHTRFYREFAAEIAPVSCVGTPLRTRNKCFGYTNYRWYLDGVFYGTGYDVEKKFESAGDHVFKMVADSAGLFKDSIELFFHIKAAPGTVGQIEGPRELCGINMVSASYQLPENENFIYYDWSYSNLPNMNIFNAGSPNNNHNFSLSCWPGSGEFFINVFAIDSLGCISDTVTASISVINTLPPDPPYLELSEYCHFLSASDINDGNSVDSIGYSVAIVPGASSYYMYKNSQPILDALLEPLGSIPTYLYCVPEFALYQVFNANACGFSLNSASDTLLTGYENLTVSHSNDTTIQSGEIVNLFAKAQLEPFFQGFCPPLLAEWFFEGQPWGWISDNLSLVATPQNAGLWTAKISNGCDTLVYNIRLDVTTALQDLENAENTLRITPNPNDGEFTVMLPEAADSGTILRLFSASGQTIRDLPIQAGVVRQQISTQELPSGLYWLQCTEAGAVKAVEKFIRW